MVGVVCVVGVVSVAEEALAVDEFEARFVQTGNTVVFVDGAEVVPYRVKKVKRGSFFVYLQDYSGVWHSLVNDSIVVITY